MHVVLRRAVWCLILGVMSPIAYKPHSSVSLASKAMTLARSAGIDSVCMRLQCVPHGIHANVLTSLSSGCPRLSSLPSFFSNPLLNSSGYTSQTVAWALLNLGARANCFRRDTVRSKSTRSAYVSCFHRHDNSGHVCGPERFSKGKSCSQEVNY